MINKKIFFLLLAIFLVSITYSFYFQYKPSVDARAYDNIAWNLAQSFGYRENLDRPISEDHAIIRAGPGYEFFLAGIYKIFGHNYKAVWFLQALLHTLAALLVFLIAENIFRGFSGGGEDGEEDIKKNKVAFLAAALYGFFPDLIIASSMLLTETLSLFLLALNTFLFLKYLDSKKIFLKLQNSAEAQVFETIASATARARGKFQQKFIRVSKTWCRKRNFVMRELKYLLGLGILIPVMILIRSNLAVFILVITPVFFKNLKTNFLRLAIFSFVFIAVFLPWTIRNYFVFNEFIPTTVLIGNNLAMGNHEGATGEQLDAPYAPLEELYKAGYIEGDKLAVKFALNFIYERPLEFLKITFYRTSIYFSAGRPASFWPSFSSLNKAITTVFSSAWAFLILVLGISGILFCFKNRNSGLFSKEKFYYFFALAALMPLSVIFIVVETRYRFPMYPFLTVFGGIALTLLFEKRKEILKPVFYSFILIFLNTLFDASRNFSRVAEKISDFLR